MPALVPMLATVGDHVPTGEEWAHEVKWDGVRALAAYDDGRVRFTNRSGKDLAGRWPQPQRPPGAHARAGRRPRRRGGQERDVRPASLDEDGRKGQGRSGA